MKYIRTKDEICEVDETTILTSMPPCYKVIKPTDKYYAINEQQVIKSADTIKELCDAFVIDKKEPFIGKLEDLPTLKYLVKLHNKNQKNKWNLYGAIWTNKGLIYVAKMNEKGELELL
jgi:hypothetical protein